MVMALCQSSYNQGVYGLVTNLGSLVVRTIFFPVEEAAFRAFSKPPGVALPCHALTCRPLPSCDFMTQLRRGADGKALFRFCIGQPGLHSAKSCLKSGLQS